jgi:hypothetical protein
VVPLTTVHMATAETKLVRTDGERSSTTTYRAERLRVHAVASNDGVLEPETVCGLGIPGTPYGEFATTFVGTRCVTCAGALGLEHPED